MCGPIASRFECDLETESEFADYILGIAKADPVEITDVRQCKLFDTPFIGSLLSSHLERSVKRYQKSEDDNVPTPSNLLPRICNIEKCGHVLLTLYNSCEGYTMSLKSSDGKWIESSHIPYSQSDLLFAIDQGYFPNQLTDLLQSISPPVIRNGHLVVEIRDYRQPVLSFNCDFDRSFHLLSCNLNSSHDSPLPECRLIDGICCDPRPAVYLIRSACARQMKHFYSTKLTGILKTRFKNSLRKIRTVDTDVSKSFFSVFDYSTNVSERRPTFSNGMDDASEVLKDLIDRNTFLMPCDAVSSVDSPASLPDSSESVVFCDEVILQQSFNSENGDVSTLKALHRFVRVRVYYSLILQQYSMRQDFAENLNTALKMAEQNIGATVSLGYLDDVICYVKQLVSLLASECGGKVELVHYKSMPNNFSVTLHKHCLQELSEGASQSSSTNPTNDNSNLTPRPNSSCTGTELLEVNTCTPQTPSSSSLMNLPLVTGLTPLFGADANAYDNG